MKAALLVALTAALSGCACPGRRTQASASESRARQAEADAVRQLYWAQQAMEGQASRRPSGRILYYVWEDLGAARDGRRLAPEEIGVPVYVPYPVTSPNNER